MASIIEKSKASGESILFYVIVLGILLALNIVGVRLFARADLTRNKQFSISDASKRAVVDLDDKLVVKAYFTADLPPPFNTTERYVRDLLGEYESRSKGNMKVVFIDPSDETTAEEARKAGITEVTHQVIEKDQASEKKGFRGLVFSYMGDTQKIPVITDTKGLEYDVTNIILMMSSEKRKVGFLQGHGEPKTAVPPQDPYNPDPNQEPAGLKMTRDELVQYQVREIDLAGGQNPVPEDLEALIVVAPMEPISELELLRIDQFIMRGGNVALFTEGVKVDASMGMLMTEPSKVGLEQFTSHFGAKVNADIVFDNQCDTLPVRGPMGIPLAKRYPGWPLAEITNEHPSTFRLPALTFPWVSSIEIVQSPTAGKVDLTVLATTTPDSWRGTGDIDLDPNQDWKTQFENAKDTGPFNLAVAIEGNFKSFFADTDLTQIKGKDGTPVTMDLGTDFIGQAKQPGRILLAGSSQMVLDPVVQILQKLHGARDRSANLAFAVNTVDWLTASQGLIEVRGKGVENARLNIEDESTRNLLKYGNILLWPLLVVAVGLIRWAIRSRKRGALLEASSEPGARKQPETKQDDDPDEGEPSDDGEEDD
jgi:gliding-associated putative ABC transporter substrate-binding component GldG